MINRMVGFKVLIFPLAAAFVVLMSVLYIKPAYDEMQLAKQDQTQKQQQFTDLQAQSQKLEELKSMWASRENDLSLVRVALPAKSNTEDYINELYGRVSRSGVLLSSITSKGEGSAFEPYACSSWTAPAPLTSGSAINVATAPVSVGDSSQNCANAVSIELSASGTWDQIINFFKYLEDTNRIVNIKAVTMDNGSQNSNGQQSSSDIINVTIGLSTFYKEKSDFGTLSAINSLASGKGFEENVLKKLNGVVFSPYVAPGVSESGERNIFK
jgi:Tfp pilus assembly protein PilO